MTDRSEMFIEGLAQESVRERAAALAELSRAELDNPAVLAAVMNIAGDEREVPSRHAPKTAVDPFSSFFAGGITGDEAPATAYTIADFASDKVMELGFVGTNEAALAIAGALKDEPVSEKLGGCAARLLGVIQWVDEEAAVRAILPALLKADLTLFEALPGLKSDGLKAAVGLALHPYARRAVNELLNHPVAGELCYKAIKKVLMTGSLDPSEVEAMELLGLLSGWTGVAKGPAKKLAQKWPWAVGFQAFDDPDAGPVFGEWLQSNPEAPPELASMLERAMLSRPGIENFPLVTFLEWGDGGCAVIKRWKWGTQCAPLLQRWVQQWWQTGERSERAWEAILLLLQVGEHGPVNEAITGSFSADGDRAVPWDKKFFKLMAEASPPVEGLLGGLDTLGRANPKRIGEVAPALIIAAGVDTDSMRDFAEAMLSMAEASEWENRAARKGIVHLVKKDVDVQGLQPVIDAIEDPALTARLDEVWPQLLQE